MLDVGIIPVKGTRLCQGRRVARSGDTGFGAVGGVHLDLRLGVKVNGNRLVLPGVARLCVDTGACADNMAALAEPPFPASGAKEPQ
jgi:hypothetical protein